MSKSHLQGQAGISLVPLSELVREDNATDDFFARICETPGCDIPDICEVVPTDTKGVTK